jgi:hypothetical protein
VAFYTVNVIFIFFVDGSNEFRWAQVITTFDLSEIKLN